MVMGQKFLRGQLVYIKEDLPSYMRFFPNGMYAIIGGSYSDKYGGDNHKEYTIYYQSEQSGKLLSCSWFEEDNIVLIDSDRDFGESLIQKDKE